MRVWHLLVNRGYEDIMIRDRVLKARSHLLFHYYIHWNEWRAMGYSYKTISNVTITITDAEFSNQHQLRADMRYRIHARLNRVF